MSYQALYRKFRPDTFEEVKGQDAVVTTLKNQIINDRIGHAYLFTGTRGTGKTSIAKLFARAVNCMNPAEGSPCGECDVCRAIKQGSSLNVIEMDAASHNGVEDVRQIVEEVTYSPTEGRYKVYIIDEVHMFSTSAFNALLKTLEEPPSYVIFILATTEVHKLPITILSRCQRYDFRRIDIPTIAGRMKELLGIENVMAEDKALNYIAKCADGSMRDALSLLDQCIAFHLGKELTYDRVLDVLGAVDTGVYSELLRCIIAGDVLKSIGLLEELVVRGRELTQFVADFTWYLRNLMLVKSTDNVEDVIDVSTEHKVLLQQEAEMLDFPVLMRYIRMFSELSNQIRYSTQKRVLLEMNIIKLCRPQMETNVDDLYDRVRQLEEKFESGDFSGAVALSKEDLKKLMGEIGSGTAAFEEKKAVPLPESLPEDVVQLAARYYEMVSRMEGVGATTGRKGRVSVKGDTFVVVFENQMEYEIFKQHGIGELRQIAEDMTGKSVKIEAELIPKGDRFEQHFADITKVDAVINFDVEEESEAENR